MAGRSDRSILAAALGLILCAATPTASFAEGIHGESQELGIKFRVAGSSAWCAARVRIELTAANVRTLEPDSVKFMQMIGRIRAVVLSQCPQTDLIQFAGTGGGAAFAAETSRLTKWRRFITFDSATRQPNCPPAVPQPQCAAQAEAYTTAVRLFAGKAFDDTEVVNTLDADSNDLTFRAKNLVGKLRIVSSGDLSGQFTSAAQFADAIAADIGGACAAESGRAETGGPIDHGRQLARRSVLCRIAGRADGQNVILVWQSAGKFRVFSLLSEGATAGEVWPFTAGLVQAIQSQH